MTPDPWEKRPTESGKAFAAFQVYRDLGPGRSVGAAYRKTKGRETGAAPGWWQEWSAANDWPARATAYDAHLERLARLAAEQETIKRRAAMLVRHAQAGQLLVARGLQYFQKEEIQAAPPAIQAIRTGVDLERQAEGLPDWVIEVLNAPEEQLRAKVADLEQRRRAAAAGVPDSAGDALSVAGSNGHQPAGDPVLSASADE